MKILLTVDGSFHSDNAVSMFLTEAWPADTQVRILTVSPRQRTFGHLNMYADQALEALHIDIQKVLAETKEQVAQKFGADKVQTVLQEGPAADMILREAKDWGADMIIMGAHGTSGYDQGLGSVTMAVINHAPCSVQVLNYVTEEAIDIKEKEHVPDEDERRFLLAVNDSPNGRAVLDEVLSREWPADARFQVLSVVQEPKGLAHSKYFKAAQIDEEHKKMYAAQKARAERLVADYAEKLDAKFGKGKVPHHVLEGNVRSLILQVAQDRGADMIMLGAHDRDKSILEHFLGSVARAVVENADCSVEIVRPRASRH